MGLRLILAILLAAACDPQARPAPGVSRAEAAAGGGMASRERETCSATRDCEVGLRCLEGVCARAGSRMGDYHWAAGDTAAAKGDHEGAAAAYSLALDKYPVDQVPSALLCSYGATLRRQAQARTAEQSARLLHRCILSAAPGSADYKMAMRELAELEAVGLDPTLLERDRPADTYLTRAPKKAPMEKMSIAVTPENPPQNRLAVAWIGLISGEEGKKALSSCFGDYWGATRKDEVQLPLTFKYKAKFDEEEEVYVGGLLEVAAAVNLAGPEATATQCAVGALSSVAAEFSKKGTGGGWQLNAMVVLSAGGGAATPPVTAPVVAPKPAAPRRGAPVVPAPAPAPEPATPAPASP